MYELIEANLFALNAKVDQTISLFNLIHIFLPRPLNSINCILQLKGYIKKDNVAVSDEKNFYFAYRFVEKDIK